MMQVSKTGTEPGNQTRPEAGTNPNREAELIRRVLEGQSEAFSELLKPHFKSLRSLVRKFVRNEFDADDIAQQTIMKAYGRLDQFRFQSSFRTWMISIAFNEIRQNGRSKRNARLVFDGGACVESAMGDGGESPYACYERKERAERLRSAIGKLPLKYRSAIEVFDLGETSLSESEESLCISTSAAKARLFRARRRLGWILRERAQ
jgi:RNA polymerase sigma-70 factor (ECF subfamily)